MKRTTIPFLAAVLLLALSAGTVHAKSAAELLREGLYAEEVEGNLDAAIGIYQQIVLDPTAPKNLAAQALYHQGMCFMKKRDEAQAREVFQKLVREYPDQTEIIAKVKPILEGLGDADPASLMPPETIVYVEIGSPGQQVATILNMLKGTPMENPFNVLNRKKDGPQGSDGGGNPIQMIQALLNPSMLAELEKVRGIGIGVQEIGKNNPPSIIVLYPGKSDALKGLIQMAMTGLGQAVSPIEGMTTVSFGEGAFAAYDDTVVILTTPSPKSKELLEWSVRQYKGRGSQPSLASANKSFARISKQARQQNALTLWLNVNETYARVVKAIPSGQVPPQLQTADGVVNFRDIEDIIATLSLRETGLALETNVGFKAGYESLAYSMIRTPNLNKAALKAVPADAIALLSFTLGGAGTAQALAASEQIKNKTGLDLGPEIFGNIEQVSAFVVPLKESVLPQGPKLLPPCSRTIGLVVTSRDPEKTQKLIGTLLQMANLLAPQSQQPPTGTGRYEIALANGLKLFGYTNDANKTLVLSLNAQLVEQSIVATKENASVLSGGPLQDALATLPPTTSKLFVVNVGAALRIAAQDSQFSSDEEAQQAKQSIEKVIQATQKTTLRVLTNESPDSFGIRLSLSDLPPLRDLFEPLAQLAQMLSHAKAQVGHTSGQAQPMLSIPPAGRAPEIDGNVDEVWAAVPSHLISHVAYAPATSAADLSANFKVMYDSQALYLLVDVTDERLVSDSAEYWLDDGVEVFLAAENNKADVYGDKDYQYHFDWDATAPALGETHHNQTNGVQYAFAKSDKGYRLEAKLPWATLGTKPAAGQKIGFDVHVNDDDDGGDRDTKIMWFGERDVAWQQPSAFGTAELAGLVGWWRMDESEGTKAADSSGNGHTATFRGNPKWQPSGGKFGGAVALSGNGDYLEVADKEAFDATAGVTVAAWIKPAALDKAWQAIVTKGEGAWRIQRNNETNNLEFACTGLKIPNGNEYGSLFGNKAIPVGEWHHVAGVYDGKTMYLYLDGVLDSSQEAWGAIGTDPDPVLIGSNNRYPDRFWNGLIDDVRVYNYGLPEAQVQQLYREAK